MKRIDRLDYLRQRLTQATVAELARKAEERAAAAPVQLTRTMLNRVIAVTPHTLLRFRQADGAQQRFRSLSRSLKALPSIGKGLRS